MRILRKAFIKKSRVSRTIADTKAYPTVQSEYMDKVRMVEVVFPYGLAGWIPLNAIGHQFNINGNEDDQAAIFNTPTERFKLAAEGEVAIGNPKSGSVIYFRANGDIILIGKNDVGIVVARNLDITALATVINSDVTTNGTLDVTGTTTVDSLVSNNGIEAAGKTGVTGLFTTSDGKTVQVQDGIIWSIV